jgi:Tfp pilus assembly protein FimT
MVTVAIIALVAGIALFGLNRPAGASHSAALARDLYFSLNRARLQATTTGFQTRMWLCRAAGGSCTRAGVWFLQVAGQTGITTPTSWANSGDVGLISRNDAAVTTIVDAGGTALAANVNASITFLPDGTMATGANEARLISVADTQGLAQHSIRVWSATGLIRMWQTP